MSLSGSVICVTGTLSISRKNFERLLQGNGAQIASAVTKNCTHLVCADPASGSSKLVKARKMGIAVVSEADIRVMAELPFEKRSDNQPTTSSQAGNVSQRKQIADGETVQVPGKEYIMKNVGGVYSCNCAGWKFQSNKIDCRTCKHLEEYLGLPPTRSSAGRKRKADSNSSSPARNTKLSKQGLFDSSNLMLAHAWDPSKHSELKNYLCSEKLDGMRALWDGNQLLSRQGNPICAPDWFVKDLPKDMALDGELFAGRGKFQKTVSIARRQNGGEQWRDFSFVVFDAPSVEGGFETRLACVRAAIVDIPFVLVHEHSPIQDRAHLDRELARVESMDGEGLMLRRKGSAYSFGRTTDLLKVKTFKDAEAIVYGHQDGKGKHEGRMGALLCRLVNGTEFKVGTGFTDTQRGNPPPVGSIITFRYFEMTKAGVPRFPTYQRLRPDVDASQFP